MRNATDNAATFVDSLWTGIKAVEAAGVQVPSVDRVNRLLTESDIPLVLAPPELRRRDGDVAFVSSPGASDASSSQTYVKNEELGRGGFGIVYRVTRTTKAGEFDFAMKVLDPTPFLKDPERAAKRFSREMQVLARLQHRGIVPHIEAGFAGDQKPYILMPLIEGDDLRESLSGAAVSEVLEAFDEILLALSYAHANKVLHRDLKPSNILVRSSDRQPIILDFGCAYLMDEATDENLTTTLVGSRPYIPPEVIRDATLHSVKQDVFACGILLHEVLVGHRPDPDEYVPIEAAVGGAPGIDRLIQSAIASERHRIGSMGEFRDRLRDIRSRLR